MSQQERTLESVMKRLCGGFLDRKAMKEEQDWPSCPPEIMEAWRERLEREHPDDPDHVRMVLNQVEVYWDF